MWVASNPTKSDKFEKLYRIPISIDLDFPHTTASRKRYESTPMTSFDWFHTIMKSRKYLSFKVNFSGNTMTTVMVRVLHPERNHTSVKKKA